MIENVFAFATVLYVLDSLLFSGFWRGKRAKERDSQLFVLSVSTRASDSGKQVLSGTVPLSWRGSTKADDTNHTLNPAVDIRLPHAVSSCSPPNKPANIRVKRRMPTKYTDE